MPRQSTNYFRETYNFPEDFLHRLARLQEDSGLTLTEIARRIGTYPHAVWRWNEGLGRPNARQITAQPVTADALGPGHLFSNYGPGFRSRTGNVQGVATAIAAQALVDAQAALAEALSRKLPTPDRLGVMPLLLHLLESAPEGAIPANQAGSHRNVSKPASAFTHKSLTNPYTFCRAFAPPV